jgi:hypothetical protein
MNDPAATGKERLVLTERQRRVLGVLIEKAMTTPDQYPLSLNSLVVGCNQKSNRDPVVSYGEGEVANALQELISKGFARYSEVPQGSRVNRFEHNAVEAFGWGPRERAVLSELMLRGPQTVGELRTRAGRMHELPDLAFTQGILDSLASDEPPQVVVLPRTPGKSAVRYAHNFYPDEEQAALLSSSPSVSASPPALIATHAPSTSPPLDNALADRVGELEDRVGELAERLAKLEQVIESLTG